MDEVAREEIMDEVGRLLVDEAEARRAVTYTAAAAWCGDDSDETVEVYERNIAQAEAAETAGARLANELRAEEVAESYRRASE